MGAEPGTAGTRGDGAGAAKFGAGPGEATLGLELGPGVKAPKL